MSNPHKVTEAAHEEFLASLLTGKDFDEIADLVIDPLILDRPPAMRKGRESGRLLEILDQLQVGRGDG